MDQLNLAKLKTKDSVFPPGFFKLLVLDILSVASAGAFGYLYWRHVSGIGFGMSILLIPMVTLVVFSVLGAIFTASTSRRMLVVALEAVACSLFFVTFKFSILMAAFLVLLITLAWGERDAHSTGQNSLEIPAYSISRGYAGKIVTGLTLFALILFSPSLRAGKVFVPEEAFKSFFTWVAGVAKGMYGEIELSADIQAFSDSLARYNLSGTKEFSSMPPNAQNQAVSQYSALNLYALQKYFCEEMPIGELAENRKPFCTALKPDEAVSSFLFRYISNVLATWRENFGLAFLISWFIFVFFFVRALGVFFSVLAAVVSFIAYHLLLATDFIKLTGEARIKEAPVFPAPPKK